MLKVPRNPPMSKGPSWRYRKIALHAPLAGLAATVAIVLVSLLAGLSLDDVFAENGAAEMLQSLVLALAGLLGIAAAWRMRGIGRFAALTTAMIAWSFLIRETPVCDSVIQTYCTTRPGHFYGIAACLTILLVAAILFWRAHGNLLLQLLHPRFSWPLALCAAFLFLGEAMEEFDLEHIEETFEVCAYVILLFGAVWLLRISGDTHPDFWDRT